MSAAVEQQFSVTAPDCQYRISARQATKTRTGKIPPWFFFSMFSAALFQGLAIHQEGAAACDPPGEAAQPQLFTALPAPVRTPHAPCSITFCLSQCSQHPCPSRLGHEPTSLQLCWASPAHPCSHPSRIYSISSLVSLPSCCVCCWERFFSPKISPP